MIPEAAPYIHMPYLHHQPMPYFIPTHSISSSESSFNSQSPCSSTLELSSASPEMYTSPSPAHYVFPDPRMTTSRKRARSDSVFYHQPTPRLADPLPYFVSCPPPQPTAYVESPVESKADKSADEDDDLQSALGSSSPPSSTKLDSERKRRNAFRSHIETLRNILPSTIRARRMTKGKLLEETIAHIQRLETENDQLRKQLNLPTNTQA